jgi:TRAP-type C4-dicarboxylate transport system permease small subunit
MAQPLPQPKLAALRVYQRLMSALAGLAGLVAGLSLLGMVAILFYQVGSRYLANYTPRWSEELAQLLTVYFSLLAAAFGYRRSLHIGVDLVRGRIKGRARRVYDAVLDLVVGGFGAAMFYWGLTEWVFGQWNQFLPGTGLAIAWQYMPLPICGAMLAMFAVERMLIGAPNPPHIEETA